MHQKLLSIWKGFVHLIYPRLCAGCSQVLLDQEQVLCIGCTSLLPLTQFHHISNNETALRLAGRINFQHASSLAYFTKEGLLQNLLHEFKYKGNKKIGLWMAQLFAQALKKTDWISEVDIIVPVPLYKKKQNKRGFNQSEIIAQRMAQLLGKELNTSAIERVIDTESQTKKSRAQRSENLKDAFRVVNETHQLAQKHILIVDDVLTTGATMEAMVQALKAIPNIRISIVTIGLAI